MVRETGASIVAPAPKKGHYHRLLTVVYTLLFIGLTALYLCLTFIPSPARAVLKEFNLTTHDYYNLVIPLEVVLVVIWAIGFFGAITVKSYAWLIQRSKDGRALSVLSDGLLVLILMQPFTSSLSGIFSIIERHHGGTIHPLTMAINYIDVALLGASFILISRGAWLLYLSTDRPARPLPQSFWVLLASVASGIYSYFVVIQPIHTPSARRVYFLSDWLLVLTIATPYIFFWYLGLYGAAYTFIYQTRVKGHLYKRGIVFISSGIAVVVVSSIVTRVIVSLSTHLTNLKISPVLIIIYALLILEAIGFILIALGADKLRRIEEV